MNNLISAWNDIIDSITNEESVHHIPYANTQKTKTAFVLELAAPNYLIDDFTIVYNNSFKELSISSNKKRLSHGRFSSREYKYDKFMRLFHINEEIEFELLDKNYENGILRITIPLKIKL